MNLLVTSDVSDEFIPEYQLQQMMKQKSAEKDSEQVNLRGSAHLMKNINSMSQEQLIENMQGPLSGMFKKIAAGKYTYLTYLMCSTACFFFWMTPNHYKIRLIKPKSNANRSSSSRSHHHGHRSSQPKPQVVQKIDSDDIEMEF